MPAIIMLLFAILVIAAIAYGLFWVVGKMGLPEPIALVARIIVGVLAILLFLSLFIPGMGVSVPGL